MIIDILKYTYGSGLNKIPEEYDLKYKRLFGGLFVMILQTYHLYNCRR